MKRLIALFTVAAVVAVPVALDAAPPLRKKKKRAAAEAPPAATAEPDTSEKKARIAPATAGPLLDRSFVTGAAARLDETIDAALQKAGVAPAPPAGDAVFLRRLYLDAAGRIPTEEEARAFLTDSRPDKRPVLIDRLLQSPAYTMQMFNWLAGMLRVKDDYGRGAKSWLYEDWLKEQLTANRPWDAMVRGMLTAEGKLNTSGASGFLLRDAQMPLDGMSNMLTTFLGADVSCAQCHDHPFAEWTQKDFYGMAAFFGASDGFHEDTFRRIRRLSRSEALPPGSRGILNQILGGNPFEMVDLDRQRLRYPEDYKYDNAKPGAKAEPAVIRWEGEANKNPAGIIDTRNPAELREEFAKWMTHPDHPRFAAAIANRLWKKTFGIAVQEPVSDLDNPQAASNPALLAQIAGYMKQAKFDLREYQRILYHTKAYQRAAVAFPEDVKHFLFPGPALRRMTAEQAWDSILTLAAGAQIDRHHLRRGDDLRALAVPDEQITMATLQTLVDEHRTEARRMQAGGAGKKGTRANPRALAPYYEGGPPPARAGLLLARASELPQPAPENHFLRLFGQSDRLVADADTTDGSVPQLLALMNGPVQEIVTRGSAALRGAAEAEGRPEKITALYHAFLSRPPAEPERAQAAAALRDGLALPDLAWVLLNSREFLFVQ